MAKLDNAPLCESRSARCNVAVQHPPRWRLIADVLLSPASRVHRYRDLYRRTLESAMDHYDCRKPCQ